MPALPAFHATCPDLALDLRAVLHLEEAAARDCELLLLHGWFEAGSWVRRELPVMPQVTAATSEYWKRHGMPQHLARVSTAKGRASVDGRPVWHHGSSRRASTWLAHR
ncbi:MAG: hypothetical protein IPM15_00765 [Betaproteobacteria bacterium]|nr:hypothetical protein [Betaproteobacteria bacterium]